jgi:hypothetical protein
MHELADVDGVSVCRSLEKVQYRLWAFIEVASDG